MRSTGTSRQVRTHSESIQDHRAWRGYRLLRSRWTGKPREAADHRISAVHRGQSLLDRQRGQPARLRRTRVRSTITVIPDTGAESAMEQLTSVELCAGLVGRRSAWSRPVSRTRAWSSSTPMPARRSTRTRQDGGRLSKLTWRRWMAARFGTLTYSPGACPARRSPSRASSSATTTSATCSRTRCSSSSRSARVPCC